MIIENSRLVALVDGAGRRIESILDASRGLAALRDLADDFTALSKPRRIRCGLVAGVVAIATYASVAAALPPHAAAIEPLAAGVLVVLGFAAAASPFRK